MRRTQLYLDTDLWMALHAQAKAQKTTVSDLVRRAARERYLGTGDERRKAMQAIVGIRAQDADKRDSTEVVLSLRRSNRLEKFNQQ